MGLPFILPVNSPLLIYQGSDFAKDLQYLTRTDDVDTEVDITDWKFRSMFRKNYKTDPPVLSLTTENGGFVIVDASLGKFRMIMTDIQTEEFIINLAQPVGEPYTVPFFDFVFDIEAIKPDLTVIPFLKGVARVYAEVTR